MAESDKAQLYENEKDLTLNILINRFIANPEKETNRLINLLKKEPENVIEFYDIYP